MNDFFDQELEKIQQNEAVQKEQKEEVKEKKIQQFENIVPKKLKQVHFVQKEEVLLSSEKEKANINPIISIKPEEAKEVKDPPLKPTIKFVKFKQYNANKLNVIPNSGEKEIKNDLKNETLNDSYSNTSDKKEDSAIYKDQLNPPSSSKNDIVDKTPQQTKPFTIKFERNYKKPITQNFSLNAAKQKSNGETPEDNINQELKETEKDDLYYDENEFDSNPNSNANSNQKNIKGPNLIHKEKELKLNSEFSSGIKSINKAIEFKQTVYSSSNIKENTSAKIKQEERIRSMINSIKLKVESYDHIFEQKPIC